MEQVINTGYRGRCQASVKVRLKASIFSKFYATAFTDVVIEHDGLVWHAGSIWWDTPGSVGMITRVIQNLALKPFTTRRTLLEYFFFEFVLLEEERYIFLQVVNNINFSISKSTCRHTITGLSLTTNSSQYHFERLKWIMNVKRDVFSVYHMDFWDAHAHLLGVIWFEVTNFHIW